ncbi:MAG: hypothetical protein KGH71_03620 [Candidatus Micrarchaeota archaeon]|nr:hypothetical protein [Candidatus Micrarchaeota archaeon]
MARKFLYSVIMFNQNTDLKITIIPIPLKDALRVVFGNRPAYDFLINDDAIIEEGLPEIYKDVASNHQIAVLLLAFWKSLSHKNIYVVSEDKKLLEIATALDKINVQCSNLIIDSQKAIEIFEAHKASFPKQ